MEDFIWHNYDWIFVIFQWCVFWCIDSGLPCLFPFRFLIYYMSILLKWLLKDKSFTQKFGVNELRRQELEFWINYVLHQLSLFAPTIWLKYLKLCAQFGFFNGWKETEIKILKMVLQVSTVVLFYHIGNLSYMY